MKPQYERYRQAGPEPSVVTSVRLPETLKKLVALIATAEQDSFTGIVTEGLLRVVEDRRDDPEYSAFLQGKAEATRSELSAKLGDFNTTPEPSSDPANTDLTDTQ